MVISEAGDGRRREEEGVGIGGSEGWIMGRDRRRVRKGGRDWRMGGMDCRKGEEEGKKEGLG